MIHERRETNKMSPKTSMGTCVYRHILDFDTGRKSQAEYNSLDELREQRSTFKGFEVAATMARILEKRELCRKKSKKVASVFL